MLTSASTFANRIDGLTLLLGGISLAIVLLVGGLVLGFAIRYRAGSNAPRGQLPAVFSRDVEIGWTAATLFIFLFLFWWATAAEVPQLEPPARALEIHVVAKQWMWKAQHANGAREVDALHVPVGVPVRLVMTSEDVIHDFYVPDFRVKADVLPGRYTQLWFEATKPGAYHLFCAEFCGTEHSRMTGTVTALPQADFARWLEARRPPESLAAQGAAAFRTLGCSGCHGNGARVRAPSLAGLYGSRVPLADGSFVTADEAYLRDSILLPGKQVAAGYAPVMPSYEGQVSEDALVPLIAYLKSLSNGGGGR